jgi:hypothetical protein
MCDAAIATSVAGWFSECSTHAILAQRAKLSFCGLCKVSTFYAMFATSARLSIICVCLDWSGQPAPAAQEGGRASRHWDWRWWNIRSSLRQASDGHESGVAQRSDPSTIRSNHPSSERAFGRERA